MSGPLLAAALAIQATGSIYSAYSQRKQMLEDANDLEAAIPELEYRARINKEEIDRSAQSLYGEQVVATAFGGAQVDTGSPMMNYANTFEQAARQKENLNREVLLQVQSYRKQASSLRSQSKKAMIAGFLGAGGNIAQGLYQHQRDTGAINPGGSKNATNTASGF